MTPVISEEAAKAKAKALRIKLSGMGIAVKHGQALELIASLEGSANWPALNAAQKGIGSTSIKKSSRPALAVRVQNDPVPTSRFFGRTRVQEMYTTLEVLGVPLVFHDPVISGFMERGGFSTRHPAGSTFTDEELAFREGEDIQPCNAAGQTRRQALKDVLNLYDVPKRMQSDILDEYFARNGFIEDVVRGKSFLVA